MLNFSYSANLDVLLSDRFRPRIKESKHLALTDFPVRKVSEILSTADSVSFGERIGWHFFDGG